jgi:myosin heavy subunit
MRKLSASTLQRESAEYKDSCIKLYDEIKDYKDRLQEKDYEIRELQYEVKRLSKTEAEWNEQIHTKELKHKAVLANTQKSLDLLERKIVGNNQIISSECDRLLQLCSALDSHTQHGHHTVPSHTFIGLLSNLRQGIANLKCADSDTVFLQGAINTTTKPQLDSALSAPAEGPPPAPLGSVESTLLEMCRHLEEENKRLTEFAHGHDEELARLRKENASVSLIPHYRLAILRERTSATRLQEALDSSQSQVRVLKEQLEVSYGDIEQLSRDYQTSQGVVKKLQQERAGLLSDLEPVLRTAGSAAGSSSSARARRHGPATGHPGDLDDLGLPVAPEAVRKSSPTSHPSSLYESDSSVPVPVRRPNAGVGGGCITAQVVQEEIHVLDDDIAFLKKKLESAAKRQTQQIVSELLANKYEM